MKLSFVIGAAVGYVVGARAGRERYEKIVSLGRKVIGSQTVQSTAGVLQAHVDDLAGKARGLVKNRLSAASSAPHAGANGYHH